MMSVPLCAIADVERPNSPRIFVDDYHECFAKSIPADDYGDRGTTAIYRVEAGTDRLISTFPWYTQQVFIRCIAPSPCPFIIQVVRIGPWARGSQATGKDLAIALYLDGRLLHSYSTLDIAKTSTNVERSSNHYSVFSAIPGYERGAGVDLFIVETIDGRPLAFNMDTGLLVDNALRVGTK
jgi:hypothetical protein